MGRVKIREAKIRTVPPEKRRGVRLGAMKGGFTRVARGFDRPLTAAEQKQIFCGPLET